MSTSYALLGILSKEPNYGYDLKKAYDKLYGTRKSLAFGQVYATLSRFARDQKARAVTEEESNGPVRKLYTITDLGRKDLIQWLSRPVEAPVHFEADFFIKIATTILLEKDPYSFLDLQRTDILNRMRLLTRKRRDGNIVRTLQADYELFHLEANMQWIRTTEERIEALKKEVQHGQ